MAAGVADSGLVYACLMQAPLALDPPVYVTPIHVGSGDSSGQLHLRELAPDWMPYQPYLGRTAGCFALKQYVQQHRPYAKRIAICHDHRFVSAERISKIPEPTYPVMDRVYKIELANGQLAKLMWPGDGEFLLCRSFGYPDGADWLSYLQQYQRSHVVEDLLRFVTMAVELEVIGREDVVLLLDETEFIAGGLELGVFPAAFWLQQIGRVERVVRECFIRYPAPPDGAESLAWSHCAERLGSYLLLKHLRGPGGKGKAQHGLFGRTKRPDSLGDRAGFLNLIVDPAVSARGLS